jgi:hypothetical protein
MFSWKLLSFRETKMVLMAPHSAHQSIPIFQSIGCCIDDPDGTLSPSASLSHCIITINHFHSLLTQLIKSIVSGDAREKG